MGNKYIFKNTRLSFFDLSYLKKNLFLSIFFIFASCQNANEPNSLGKEGEGAAEIFDLSASGPAIDSGGGDYLVSDKSFLLSQTIKTVFTDHFESENISKFHKYVRGKLKSSFELLNINVDEFNKIDGYLKSLTEKPGETDVQRCIESKMKVLNSKFFSDFDAKEIERGLPLKMPRHFILESLDYTHSYDKYGFDYAELVETVKSQCSRPMSFAIYNFRDIMWEQNSRLNNALHSSFYVNESCKDLSENAVGKDMVVSSFSHDAFLCISSETSIDLESLSSESRLKTVASLLYHEYVHSTGEKDEVIATKFQKFISQQYRAFYSYKETIETLSYFSSDLESYLEDYNSLIEYEMEFMILYDEDAEKRVLENLLAKVNEVISSQRSEVFGVYENSYQTFLEAKEMLENRLRFIEGLGEAQFVENLDGLENVTDLKKLLLSLNHLSKLVSVIIEGEEK